MTDEERARQMLLHRRTRQAYREMVYDVADLIRSARAEGFRAGVEHCISSLQRSHSD